MIPADPPISQARQDVPDRNKRPRTFFLCVRLRPDRFPKPSGRFAFRARATATPEPARTFRFLQEPGRVPHMMPHACQPRKGIPAARAPGPVPSGFWRPPRRRSPCSSRVRSRPRLRPCRSPGRMPSKPPSPGRTRPGGRLRASGQVPPPGEAGRGCGRSARRMITRETRLPPPR